MIGKKGNIGNLKFFLALFLLMLVPIVNSLVVYTSTVVITPQQIITILKPDSATKLVEITAQSAADSSAATSTDILNLLIDDDITTGEEIIYNYPGNNKDACHSYSLNFEPSTYSKVEIRVYFSLLEVMPYDWTVFVYQPDADNINTGYYVDGSSSGTGWVTVDVSSIIHQLDGQGFMKVRFISSTHFRNRGKIAIISEMEWILTS